MDSSFAEPAKKSLFIKAEISLTTRLHDRRPDFGPTGGGNPPPFFVPKKRKIV